ncbi:MAG: hypothetical protein Q4B26_02285 [Eubacteriales bacterium]|nr:hypothetical protein [Eubacteriales bacterium]
MQNKTRHNKKGLRLFQRKYTYKQLQLKDYDGKPTAEQPQAESLSEEYSNARTVQAVGKHDGEEPINDLHMEDLIEIPAPVTSDTNANKQEDGAIKLVLSGDELEVAARDAEINLFAEKEKDNLKKTEDTWQLPEDAWIWAVLLLLVVAVCILLSGSFGG